MLIREIKKSDDLVIAGIVRTVMNEFDANPETTILGDPSLNRMFDNYQAPGSVYFILEDNAVIAGGCGIKQLDNSNENICELQRMFLLPSSRGKHFGKMLIDLCIQKAKDYKYNSIYLETLSQMTKAISLYEKAGFKKINSPLGNTGHSGCNVYMVLTLV